MNRLANKLVAFVPILLVMLVPVHGRAKPHYTFILPDGYVGWVQVIFNDPQASALPIRKDAGRVIEVPESGVPQTSDIRVHDDRGRDEFYYRSVLPNGGSELHAMPPEYVLLGEGHGGWGVMNTGGSRLLHPRSRDFASDTAGARIHTNLISKRLALAPGK